MPDIPENHDDAMVMVQARNQFYQKKTYLLLGILCLTLAVAAALAGILLYLMKHPTQPVYFVADESGRLVQEIPLSQPDRPLEEVAAWVVEAVENAYTYNYINFRAQLQSAEKYFSPYGWQQYMKGLTASNNLLALEQRKMLFIAKVTAPPKLLIQGRVGGSYAYKFEMPVLVAYLSPPYDNVLGKSRFDNALIVRVIVQRQKRLLSYKGLAILQLLASVPPQGVQNITNASS